MFTAHNILPTIANRLYLAGLFLVPLTVVASYTMPILTLKMLIAAIALVGALILTVLSAFKRGGLSLPLSLLVGSVWLLPLAYLIAGLLGPAFTWSLVGAALDMDTVFFMTLIGLSVSLPYALFEKRTDTVRAILVLFAVSWVVGIFHLARLFLGAETLSFGVMTNELFSPLGKWNDVAIFYGLIALVALISLETMVLKAVERYVLLGTLAISVFFVAVVNFMPVWIALALLSFGVVLYKFLLAPREGSMFSFAATIVFVIAVTASLFTSTIGSSLGRALNIEQIEARPSWSSTFEVTRHALNADPITGIGPNLFVLEWDKSRPAELNQSIFWNADFTSGVGMLPSVPTTTGLLGTLAWALFIGLFIAAGVRGLIQRLPADPHTTQLMSLTFLGALYVVVMSAVYLPSPQVLLVGFSLMGMFGALYHREWGRNFDVDFRDRPRVGFVLVLGLALTLVGSVLSFYGVGTVFAAARAYEQAAYAAQVGANPDRSLEFLETSLALYPTDQAYRLRTLAHLAKLNEVVSGATTPSAEVQQQFQRELGAAVESGLSAVRLNGENYRNWAVLGAAYQSVVPLNVDGSYDASVNAYNRARELNPLLPSLPLSLAQIELSRERSSAARPHLEEAVTLKPDFTAALTLLAQLELQDGNIKKAIDRAESAALFEPSNPIMHFQVGILKFEDTDYRGAGESFARAVQLAPEYSNARYYLGRVYYVLKDTERAIAEFTEVLRLNPDNADVTSVLAALKSGRNPFSTAPQR